MRTAKEKTFPIQPTAGPLDMTSSPDGVPFGGYRYVENFETSPQDRKMRRMTGYQRLLSGELNENADLHYRYGKARQHITFAFEAKTPSGFTKLFAATQNDLFSMSNSDRVWSPIWSGFGGTPDLNGCSDVILQAASVGSTVIFTNDFDEPVYHVIDQPANTNGKFVQPVRDFKTLNITRVGFIYSWNNLVIIANVVMDGVRQTNAVLWSDYKKPLSFAPSSSSLAGRKFLAYGEVVLNAAEIADALLLYTNRGIWEVRTTSEADADGNPLVLSFTKRYTANKSASRCLKYPRTLVSTGRNHYFAGEDGIYLYNFYLPEPEIQEWSRRATSHLFLDGTFSNLNCATPCGGYNAAKRAIWFSYPRHGDQCNAETLVMNTETYFSSIVQEGFSFFLSYNPKSLLSLRQWMADMCICPVVDMPFRDGCVPMEQPECTLPISTSYATNAATKTVHSIPSENWDQTHDDSLRKKLNGYTSLNFCAAESNGAKCSSGTLFLMGSVLDRCIKQLAPVYYREQCTTFTVCGVYEQTGYISVLRSGPINLQEPSTDKVWKRFFVELDSEVSVIPGNIALRVGVSATALDSNQSTCPIIWARIQNRDGVADCEIKCLADRSEQTYVDDNQRPDGRYDWPLYIAGKYHYFEFLIHNMNTTPANTGAGVAITRIEFDAILSD